MRISKIFAIALPVLLAAFAARAQQYTLPDYVPEPDSPHVALIVLSEAWADVREISGEVVKYHVREYPEAGLISTRVTMPFLSKLPVLYIHTFPDKAAAMYYYDKLYREKPDFMQMNIVEAVWILSKGNLNTLLLEESIQRYEGFFRKHYLKRE
jgi:hypothetical protein